MSSPTNNIGVNIFSLWYVMALRVKEIILPYNNCHDFLLIPFINIQTPRMTKNNPTFASYATRENCICQGERASNPAVSNGTYFVTKFLSSCSSLSISNSFTRKYVTNTVSDPNNAEGKRTAKGVNPNNLIDSAVRYTYTGCL